MKRTIFTIVCFFCLGQLISKPEVHHTISFYGHITPYVATEDSFDHFFSPEGRWELGLGKHLAIGASLLYNQWSDYLRCFCGRYDFQVLRPGIDFSYHFSSNHSSVQDIFAGCCLSYHFIFIENELNNEYFGDLKDHITISPFVGLNLYPFSNQGRFWQNIALSARASWNVVGDFSGIYAQFGILLSL